MRRRSAQGQAPPTNLASTPSPHRGEGWGEGGQVTLETAVCLTAVSAGLVFMLIYLQRGVQGGAKASADGLGTQFDAVRTWNHETVSTAQARSGQELRNSQTSSFVQELQ